MCIAANFYSFKGSSDIAKKKRCRRYTAISDQKFLILIFLLDKYGKQTALHEPALCC